MSAVPFLQKQPKKERKTKVQRLALFYGGIPTGFPHHVTEQAKARPMPTVQSKTASL